MMNLIAVLELLNSFYNLNQRNSTGHIYVEFIVGEMVGVEVDGELCN